MNMKMNIRQMTILSSVVMSESAGFSASDEAKNRIILQDLPVTVLFIDGNHENFEQLNSYPLDVWNGGKVHSIDSNLIHLM